MLCKYLFKQYIYKKKTMTIILQTINYLFLPKKMRKVKLTRAYVSMAIQFQRNRSDSIFTF